jgi:hypothetical protein
MRHLKMMLAAAALVAITGCLARISIPGDGRHEEGRREERGGGQGHDHEHEH